MKKLLNIPKHQQGALLRLLLKSRLKTIANLISDTPLNEQKLVQIARATARATEKLDVKTIKNIDNLLQRELSYSLGRPVDGFPGAKPLELMTDDELVKIIPEWRVQSVAPVILTPQKTGPLSQEEINILKNLYSKKPYDLTKEEVKVLLNLSRRQNGLTEPVDERIPSLAPFTTEGAVDSRYIYRNPSGSYDDLPTYLPTAPWKNSNNFYKQKGGTLTPQDLDISKFLKNYPVKYRRTSKGISPEDYAKYMKLMRTATGDDVVEFLLKEGYITLKNQTKKFLNPDGPIPNDKTPENLNQFSWWDVVPGVGTYRDLQRSYYNPSTKNISIAALSTAGDILGAGVLFKTLKNAGRLSKVHKALKARNFKPLDESKTLWQKITPKHTEPLLSGYRYPGYKLEYKNIPSLDLSPTVSWAYGYIPTKTIIESNK